MTRERWAVAAVSGLLLFLTLFRGVTPIFPFDTGSNGVFFDEAARLALSDDDMPTASGRHEKEGKANG